MDIPVSFTEEPIFTGSAASFREGILCRTEWSLKTPTYHLITSKQKLATVRAQYMTTTQTRHDVSGRIPQKWCILASTLIHPKCAPSNLFSPFSQLHMSTGLNTIHPTISCMKTCNPITLCAAEVFPQNFPFFKVFLASIRCASLARKPFLGIKRTRPHALCSAICPWPARRKSSTKTALTFKC